MANINHNRPYLKFIDNLRHVLADADRRSKPENIQSLRIEKEPKTLVVRKSRQIVFYGNEWELCNDLFVAIEAYFDCFNDFLKHFPKGSGGRKIKLEEAEAALRKCISLFLAEYVQVKAINAKNSGLHKFWKLLVKGLETDGIIAEMISQEIRVMDDAMGEV